MPTASSCGARESGRSTWPTRARRESCRSSRCWRACRASRATRLPRSMRVTMLPDVEPRPRRLAVGQFDGVHLGHREVISGSDTVLTFEPHPLRVVRPEAAPKLLTSLETKAALIESLGVDELVVIPFDEGFAHQSPQDFIDQVLVGQMC